MSSRTSMSVVIDEHSPDLLFAQLKVDIMEACSTPEMVIPYLEKIEKALEEKKGFTILELLDDLEEMLDITLFSAPR